MSNMEKLSKTFEDLYREGCKIRKEDPVHMEMYKDLDKLLIFIKNHPSIKYEVFERVLSYDRVCMVIPYSASLLNGLLPSHGEDKDGNPQFFECIGWEQWKVMIINEMDNSYRPDIFNEMELNEWKIERLEKVVNNGWEEFAMQYIKGCKKM